LTTDFFTVKPGRAVNRKAVVATWPVAVFVVIANVYFTPFFNPMKTHDVSVVVHVELPGDDVTTYVTPIDVATAGHATVMDLLLAVDIDVAGTSGIPSGNPVPVVAEPVPYVLVPATDTVYSVPLIRPVIVQVVFTVAVEVQVASPGVAVAVYLVSVLSSSACTHDISSALLFVATTSPVTAPGGPTGVTATAVEEAPTPTAFVAVTEIE
jgi:hypothetical protein